MVGAEQKAEQFGRPEGLPGQQKPPVGRWTVWVALALLVGLYIYANRPVTSAFTWEHDYEAGLRKAGQEKQFVLLEFHTAGCGACEWMDREVFSKPQVARALDGWVPIRVDGNREPELATRYGVEGFPAFRALSRDGKVLAGFSGARPMNEFLAFLDSARTIEASRAG